MRQSLRVGAYVSRRSDGVRARWRSLQVRDRAVLPKDPALGDMLNRLARISRGYGPSARRPQGIRVSLLVGVRRHWRDTRSDNAARILNS